MKREVVLNLIRFFSLFGMIMFIAGCAGPKMLQQREGVPSAALEPVSGTSGTMYTTDLSAPTECTAIPEESIGSSEFPAFQQETTKSIQYTVKRGDSFWKISRMYGVGMRELAAYNNMDIGKQLQVGKVLDIPPGGKLVPKSELSPIKPRTVVKKANIIKGEAGVPKGGTYTVKSGDSLWVIARKYGTTVDKITTANNINKNTTLHVGQQLIIPGGHKPVKTTVTTKKVSLKTETTKAVPLSKKDSDLINNLIDTSQTKSSSTPPEESSKQVNTTISNTDNYLPHTVKDGDTWETISEMYGVSVDSLKKANPKIASDDQPKVDTVINIPEE